MICGLIDVFLGNKSIDILQFLCHFAWPVMNGGFSKLNSALRIVITTPCSTAYILQKQSLFTADSENLVCCVFRIFFDSGCSVASGCSAIVKLVKGETKGYIHYFDKFNQGSQRGANW